MPNTVVDAPVHVAAGIVFDESDRIFLTRRVLSAHQGGKWEFPGGKVEPGESVDAALRRELQEELGIDVRAAQRFMQVRHAYADKNVLLDVWIVASYTGTPHGREGQEGAWVARSELLDLEFPAADRPIQRRLWSPALYAISDCARYGHDIFFKRLEKALVAGLRLLQWREPITARAEYLTLARDVVALCHRHGAKVLLNADPADVDACGADGVHLNSARLKQYASRPLSRDYFVGASCHDATELAQAGRIEADLVVLGPVASTPSHPDREPLGWENFAALCRGATPLVYALGGMRPEDLSHACARGARGVAMISGVWEAADVAQSVASVR